MFYAYYNLGLRVDGRRPPELRKLQCKLGVFQQADGSAFMEQGNTKVLATVYGPHDVRPHLGEMCIHLIIHVLTAIDHNQLGMWYLIHSD